MLPGGLWENGTRVRDYSFKTIDGRLEVTLANALNDSKSLPGAVSVALSESLAEIGGEPVTLKRARQLCVADRQYLMRQLDTHLGNDEQWMSKQCHHCQEKFDFHIRHSDLPVSEASQGYPFFEYVFQDSQLTFRLPNGEDQEHLVRQNLPVDVAQQSLLRNCLLQNDFDIEALSEQQVDDIDKAMENLSPGVITRISVSCPECNQNNEIDLDPYHALLTNSQYLLQQVHVIASHYHWSEQEILSLPKSRRQTYLDLIDQARGMVS